MKDKIYAVTFSTNTNHRKMLCWSDNKTMVYDYINQLDKLKYKSIIDYDLTISTYDKALDIEHSLTHISSDIIVTWLEYRYYGPVFTELYNNMKTSISSMILYNKLCNGSNNDIPSVASLLYHKCDTFMKFMDSMDTDVILKTYFNHPIDIMHTLEENYRMEKEFNNIIGNSFIY